MADNGRYDTPGTYTDDTPETAVIHVHTHTLSYTDDTPETAVHLVHTRMRSLRMRSLRMLYEAESVCPSCAHSHQTQSPPLLSFKFKLNTQRTKESASFCHRFVYASPLLTNKKKHSHMRRNLLKGRPWLSHAHTACVYCKWGAMPQRPRSLR
jgi:hypothetical protein